MTTQRDGVPVLRVLGTAVIVASVTAMAGANNVALTEVGSPIWQPVDFITTSGPGTSFQEFLDSLNTILAPPNHVQIPGLGIGPGDPHAGPYDQEMSDGLANSGFPDTTTFLRSQFTLTGDVVITGYMVIPRAGAPTGRTPDSADGPMIPNDLFPIVATIDIQRNGQSGWDSGQTTVPPLDGNVDAAFAGMEGHSHFPVFGGDACEFGNGFQGFEACANDLTLALGDYTRVVEIRDAAGNGWNFSQHYTIVPVPGAVYSGAVLFGLVCAVQRLRAKSRRAG